ncbi:MAG TPA: hypothetical protein VEA80_08870 [Vitreimonas sp.]|uniref:hypothetical protein n=1 Tax=Vitreimonas sp. TaxID=3069702 RepID=UPI002D6E08C8|nr:hypothetical protein [Vitreimonas sp.]HYD87572.1 hypothetical protein [Vitreimonas sp.]
MRLLTLAAAMACAALIGVGEANAQRNAARLGDIQITSLAIDVSPEHSEFEVIDARMDETATAAVFFGMIGAVVNSADNNIEDQQKAEPLVPTAESIDLDTLITQALTERLASRNAVPLAESADGASNTLLVEIGEWGLIRRSQRPDTTMRAFLKLNVSVLDARGRRVFGPERQHSIGQMTAELSDFTPEAFRAEMEALAVRAGQQVANTVIYR